MQLLKEQPVYEQPEVPIAESEVIDLPKKVPWNNRDRLIVILMSLLVLGAAMGVVATSTQITATKVRVNAIQDKINDQQESVNYYQDQIQHATNKNALAGIAKDAGMTQDQNNIRNISPNSRS